MRLVGKHFLGQNKLGRAFRRPHVKKTGQVPQTTVVPRVSSFLHKTLFNALFDLVALARLGIEAEKRAIGFSAPLVAQVEQRLMSFLLHNLEARFWRYDWRQWAFPEAFGALLSPHFCECPTLRSIG
jgi:hypothetical protein